MLRHEFLDDLRRTLEGRHRMAARSTPSQLAVARTMVTATATTSRRANPWRCRPSRTRNWMTGKWKMYTP